MAMFCLSVADFLKCWFTVGCRY